MGLRAGGVGFGGCACRSSMLRPCRDVRLDVSLGEFCGNKGGQWSHTRGFDEGVRPKLGRWKRRKGQLRLQDTDEEQAGVNYSYYRILYS